MQDALLGNAMPLLVKYASTMDSQDGRVELKPPLNELVGLYILHEADSDKSIKGAFSIQSYHKNAQGTLHVSFVCPRFQN